MGYVYPKGNFSQIVDFVTFGARFSFEFFFFLFLLNILTFLRFKESNICFLLQFYFFGNIEIIHKKELFLILSEKKMLMPGYFAIFPNFRNLNNFFLEFFFSISKAQKKKIP